MTTSPYFAVESDTLGTLRVSGAISYANAGRALLQAPQAPRGGSRLDVDLSALENADSATLAVLIAWAARVQKLGGELRLRNAPQALRNLAHLSDLDGLLGLA